MMPQYVRAYQPGGTFFFTVVTYHRRPFLTEAPARSALRLAMEETRENHPFRQEAIVLLPDHLHCLWTLPEGDANFSVRWQVIKSKFSRHYLRCGGSEGRVTMSRLRHHERALWQRRFWEHSVRDEKEFGALCDYIHYNPVKHGHVHCPHAWPYSTFGKFVNANRYDRGWCCGCERTPDRRKLPPVDPAITGE